MLKLKGLNKAIGDYHRANSGGPYSPRYGVLMLDKSTGEIWTDEFYDLGHRRCAIYKTDNIINLGYTMENEGWEITRDNIKEYCLLKYRIVSKYLKAKYIVEVFDGIRGYDIECENYKDALKKYAEEKDYYMKNKTEFIHIELNKYTIENRLIQKLFKTIVK